MNKEKLNNEFMHLLARTNFVELANILTSTLSEVYDIEKATDLVICLYNKLEPVVLNDPEHSYLRYISGTELRYEVNGNSSWLTLSVRVTDIYFRNTEEE